MIGRLIRPDEPFSNFRASNSEGWRFYVALERRATDFKARKRARREVKEANVLNFNPWLVMCVALQRV